MDRSSPMTPKANKRGSLSAHQDDDEQELRDPEEIMARARLAFFHECNSANRPDAWVGGYSPEYHFHRRRLSAAKPIKIEGYNAPKKR